MPEVLSELPSPSGRVVQYVVRSCMLKSWCLRPGSGLPPRWWPKDSPSSEIDVPTAYAAMGTNGSSRPEREQVGIPFVLAHLLCQRGTEEGTTLNSIIRAMAVDQIHYLPEPPYLLRHAENTT